MGSKDLVTPVVLHMKDLLFRHLSPLVAVSSSLEVDAHLVQHHQKSIIQLLNERSCLGDLGESGVVGLLQ